jgi:2-polyprenyl-6-methoxyphenol hydroxylase-like FAD-dependent oxidoreductase
MIGVRPALKFPNVTLLRNCKVVKLNTNANGMSVKEVVVARDGEREVFSGDIVVVACGAANSASGCKSRLAKVEQTSELNTSRQAS